MKNLLRAVALALAAILAMPAMAAVQLPNCLSPTGQQVWCTGATLVDGAGVPVQGGAGSKSGTLAAAGDATPTIALRGSFNVTLQASAASMTALVLLERSFDNGTSWAQAHLFSVFAGPSAAFVVSDSLGTAGGATGALSVTYTEGEAGVLYCMRATSISGGSVTVRLSQ